MTASELKELKAEVALLLSKERYSHTIEVMREVRFLTKYFIANKRCELQRAALFHDIAKDIPLEEQLELCEKIRVPITKEEREIPQILHAKASVAMVKDKFPSYATEEILTAIAQHTTGEENMTLFSKILFLADFTERTRKYPSALECREAVHQGLISAGNKQERLKVLNEGVIFALKATLMKLSIENQPICTTSLRAYYALQMKFG